MDIMELISMLSRWGHLLFGITWIGLLYYFNFIQGGYFKAATPEALKDAKAKLAPEALWWFRWGAMGTFLTGLILLVGMFKLNQINDFIIVGATLGTVMFLNVWLVIWPNQKVALGMVEGDGPTAAGKALLASRTNTLFSGPMAFMMLSGGHFGGYADGIVNGIGSIGLWIALGIVALLAINGLKGKMGPIETVRGVIVHSLVLTAVFVGILKFL